MPCTTILVGKRTSYDGSTMTPGMMMQEAIIYSKKYVSSTQKSSQKVYKSVISHIEISLPEHPMRYSAAPNAIPGQGMRAACGVNEKCGNDCHRDHYL